MTTSPFASEGLIAGSLRFLRDLLDQLLAGASRVVGGIVNNISKLPIVLAMAGCETPTPDVEVIPPALTHESRTEPAPAPTEAAPVPIGDFAITFYYVVTEEEVPRKPVAQNDNIPAGDTQLAAVSEDANVTLYDGECKPIADVTTEFASALALQGTGKLHDGRVLNIWGYCSCGHSPCFKVTAAQWGTGGTGKPLQPFRTVAVDPKMVKLGSLLYVPILEGRQMPGRAPWGGFVHDGCVVADDVGGGIKGTQLDLFVGRRGWFLGMSNHEGSHAWAQGVPVYDGTKICERRGRHVAKKSGAI